MNRSSLIAAAALLGTASAAGAYPGGTPTFQTDAAPYCAACHASRDVSALAGAGERATKETSEHKHISVILSGQHGYQSLSEPDRKTLAEQIRALDTASTIELKSPASVKAGEVFQVQVRVTGGGGPVVGVGLVDRDHRWYARPAPSAGWQVVASPEITAADGQPRTDWLAKRPAELGRNLSFVNITNIQSDPAAKKYDSAEVIFTLRAPDRPGSYPLAGVFLYGTEKSTLLGYTTNSLGQKEIRGGFTGGSGRVLFTKVRQIQVQ